MMLEPESLAFIGTSDLSGLLRGVAVPWAALDGLMGRGAVLPGHVPLRHPSDPHPFGAADLLLLPDPATRAYVPTTDAPDLVLLLGDLLELDGAPWACCPRYFLRRALAALHAEFGLTVRAGIGQRFTLPASAAEPGRSLAAARRAAAFCGTLLAAMRANGMTADTLHPADGAGEFEAAAADAIGIAAADEAVVLRELIGAVAERCGAGRATLGRVRIGLDLRDGFGQSAMADPSGEHGLSDEAEHWAAGVLHHLPVLAAVLFGRNGAPRRAELATEGRPGAWRLRSDVGDDGVAIPAGFELTGGDPAASPYLALGALVWAGLDGLRQHRRLAELDRHPLPATPAEALDAFGGSIAAAEWFGMELREQFLRYARWEHGLNSR